MKINEVIKLSCDFLGLGELKSELDAGGEIENEKLSRLLTCLNLAYEEIVTEYLPILTTEKVGVLGGKVLYSSLSKPISGISCVKNENGEEICYQVSADHIDIDAKSAEITYQIMPEKCEFGEEVNVLFPERLLAYGTAREYLFIEGMSDEAILYERRFKEALVNFVRKKSIARLPKRTWKV